MNGGKVCRENLKQQTSETVYNSFPFNSHHEEFLIFGKSHTTSPCTQGVQKLHYYFKMVHHFTWFSHSSTFSGDMMLNCVWNNTFPEHTDILQQEWVKKTWSPFSLELKPKVSTIGNERWDISVSPTELLSQNWHKAQSEALKKQWWDIPYWDTYRYSILWLFSFLTELQIFVFLKQRAQRRWSICSVSHTKCTEESLLTLC